MWAWNLQGGYDPPNHGEDASLVQVLIGDQIEAIQSQAEVIENLSLTEDIQSFYVSAQDSLTEHTDALRLVKN